MVSISKVEKDISCQCTSCLCANEESDIYEFKIGKSQRQTITFKLCRNCLFEFISNSINAVKD